MKKLIALISALSLVLVLASCGDEKPAETSPAAPTPAPASSVEPTVVPTIEPTPTPEPVEDNNLAHAEDATCIDMNTGKADGDEGYLAYYNATDTVDIAFDANVSTGWQLAENLEQGEAEQAESDPDHYYVAADNLCYKKTAFEDGTLWLGVTFAEAKTINNVKLFWESGSAAKKAEDDGYYLQFTADGEKWEKLDATVTRDEETRVAENIYVDDAVFDAKEVKGVRVVVLEGTTKYAPKVWEMEIYAPEEEAPAEETAE